MICKNQFPTVASDSRLAIVGESPGADEDRLGIPFCGYSGQLLDKLLSRARLQRGQVFVGNICQHRPPQNDITIFGWNSNFVQDGLKQLKQDLDAFKPNVILLLGNYALKAAKDPVSPSTQYKISDWRGSVFMCDDPNSPLLGYKCLPSIHPAFVLRSYDQMPFLMLDIRKAAKQAEFPEVRAIKREFVIPTLVSQALQELKAIQNARIKTAFDIEGYWNNLRCIGFSNDIRRALVIPFTRKSGARYWSRQDEPFIWRGVAELLEDEQVPKVAQAGLYDRFCLHYGQYIRVRGVTDDTMAKHWSLYSELAKDTL